MSETVSTEIKLVQLPVIEHRLKAMGASVTERIAALNIDSLVATEDTVKTLKELRTELNKELKAFEEQRMIVKKAISEPYQKFEELYKDEISTKYTTAVEALKDKIAKVETQILDEKKEKVVVYFNELCQAEGIDFLTWDKLGITIQLSISLKKYKEQVNEFVSKVQDDLALINTNEFKTEILVEYKNTLNVAASITTVQTRKEQEKMERERQRQATISQRKRSLEILGLTYADMVDSYEFQDKFGVTMDEVKNLTDKDWMRRLAEIEQAIIDHNRKNPATPEEAAPAPAAPVSAPKPTASAQVSKPTASKLNGQDRQEVQSSQTSTADRIVTALFEVKGTYAALKALGQYMRDHNIEYKNI